MTFEMTDPDLADAAYRSQDKVLHHLTRGLRHAELLRQAARERVRSGASKTPYAAISALRADPDFQWLWR